MGDPLDGLEPDITGHVSSQAFYLPFVDLLEFKRNEMLKMEQRVCKHYSCHYPDTTCIFRPDLNGVLKTCLFNDWTDAAEFCNKYERRPPKFVKTPGGQYRYKDDVRKMDIILTKDSWNAIKDALNVEDNGL